MFAMRMWLPFVFIAIASVCLADEKSFGDGSTGSPSRATSSQWPQWRGPNRDGISTETGLLRKWPEGGPKLLWEITGLGIGYSSVAISGGRLYTMGDRSIVEQGRSTKAQCVIAYDIATLKELWAAKLPMMPM